jgi:AhpD family alkylhydroperoxidase
MGCAVAALAATGNGNGQGIVSYILQQDDPVERRLRNDSRKLLWHRTMYGILMLKWPKILLLKGLPAQLRMNAIASHGGTTKANFEAFSLAASIVGKCEFCVKAHYDGLKKLGYSVEQLRDIGRIAAVMNSVAKVLNS